MSAAIVGLVEKLLVSLSGTIGELAEEMPASAACATVELAAEELLARVRYN
jgi:hypothetical protein